MSSKISVTVLAICLAGLIVAGGLIVLNSSFEIPFTKEYSIEYETNGGTNNPLNETTYLNGTEVTLYAPTSETLYFKGWYTDSELTDRISKISRSMTGDLKLYASWGEDESGTGFMYDVNGTRTEVTFDFLNMYKTYTYVGTHDVLYLDYKDKSYLYTVIDDGTYKYNSEVVPSHDERTKWSESSDADWGYEGDITLDTVYGKVDCEIHKGIGKNFVDVQYIGKNDGVVYLEKYDYENEFGSLTVSNTYTLTDIVYFDVDDKKEVKAYADDGITISGSGTYDIGNDVTLVAHGSNFKGWYDNFGNLLSSENTYNIETITEDATIYAMNDKHPDLMINAGESVNIDNMGYSSAKWNVFNDGELITSLDSPTFAYDFTTPGIYFITSEGVKNGEKYYTLFSLVADGFENINYTWYDGFTKYSLDLEIKYSDYYTYKNDDVNRHSGSKAHNTSFVTYNDPYIQKLTSELVLLSEGMSDMDRANFILTFVQNIPYVTDEVSAGKEEYWKYPLETLFEKEGDCEDTTFIYCAIMENLGYNTALLLFNGHMAAGLETHTEDDIFLEKGNPMKFAFCETTGTPYDVGESPNYSLYNPYTCLGVQSV